MARLDTRMESIARISPSAPICKESPRKPWPWLSREWGVGGAAGETARSTQGLGGEGNARFWCLVLGWIWRGLGLGASRFRRTACRFRGLAENWSGIISYSRFWALGVISHYVVPRNA